MKPEVLEDQEQSNGVTDAQESKAPKKATKTVFTVYEKWQLKNDKGELKRIGKLKDCKMLPEQANLLNVQKHNSLVEYIEKEA